MNTASSLFRFTGVCLLGTLLFGSVALAQTTTNASSSEADTNASSTASSSVNVPLDISERLAPLITAETKDTTQPEQIGEKVAILQLLESRIVDSPNIFNFFAYWVQQAIFLGIPANTIALILLTPVLALIVTFFRVIIGLQSLELLVPIALAFAFVAVGVPVGLIILVSVLLASYVSNVLLKRLSIMFFPKRALSMSLLAIFVFAALTVAAVLDLSTVQNLSIFPIVILTLLGDSIVSIQLYKSYSETILITTVTIALGLLGYALVTSDMIINSIILYPELILLTIPANVLIGRYFGLRLMEYFRFGKL